MKKKKRVKVVVIHFDSFFKLSGMENVVKNYINIMKYRIKNELLNKTNNDIN